jgi:hypothetical protein
MNHEEARKSNAAEAYILDDLNSTERDAFEEHFFDCTECTADVRDAAKVAGGVRTATRVVPLRNRFNWWAAASVVFAALLGYQSLVVVPRMATNREARVQNARVLMSEPQLLSAESRGPSVAIVFVRADEPVLLEVPFAATTQGPHRGEILDVRSRKIGDSFDVPDTGDLVPLFVPAGTLHPGNYTLVIRGAGGQEDSMYRIEVRSR